MNVSLLLATGGRACGCHTALHLGVPSPPATCAPISQTGCGKTVISRLAAVGQGGLQINEPGTARSLKNLPVSWSDMALACLIHVGM